MNAPRRRALLLLALLLGGCAAVPVTPVATMTQLEAPLAQRYAELQAREGGRLYGLDPAGSQLLIHVFRAGRAAQLGHNHVLSAPQLAGQAWLPETGLAGARFELEARLDQLELDAPARRAALGPGWASLLSPEAVAATRTNMLGDGLLQAATFPWVRIRSLQLGGELPKLAAQIELELHGRTRSLWLPLQAELAGPQLRASGALVLRQSDFGIVPFTVFGGLLAVRDELVIEFELRLLQSSPSKGSTSTNSPAATSP